MNYKCRAGRHDFPCGPTNSPYGDQCACGCSAGDWCDEQCATITPENVTHRLERFYVLNLIETGRMLDEDEREELNQLRHRVGEYLRRTTPNLFEKK